MQGQVRPPVVTGQSLAGDPTSPGPRAPERLHGTRQSGGVTLPHLEPTDHEPRPEHILIPDDPAVEQARSIQEGSSRPSSTDEAISLQALDRLTDRRLADTGPLGDRTNGCVHEARITQEAEDDPVSRWPHGRRPRPADGSTPLDDRGVVVSDSQVAVTSLVDGIDASLGEALGDSPGDVVGEHEPARSVATGIETVEGPRDQRLGKGRLDHLESTVECAPGGLEGQGQARRDATTLSRAGHLDSPHEGEGGHVSQAGLNEIVDRIHLSGILMCPRIPDNHEISDDK